MTGQIIGPRRPGPTTGLRSNADEPTVRGAPVLEISGVTKSFGSVHALRDVDLVVAAGEVVGLLGPNGSGKTTLLRIISTLLAPDAGTVSVCGDDIGTDPVAVRAHLGLAGQHASVDELLTGRENLELVGALYGLASNDCTRRSGDLLGSLGLVGAADRRVSTYSGGMRRRLDLGATLIGEPSLLLLDEPTVGLDPQSRHDLWGMINEIAGRGISVLVTSQYLDEVERLADRVVVLREGTVIADDDPRALQTRAGGRVLDIRVDDPSQVTPTLQALADLAVSPRVDSTNTRISVPSSGGLPAARDAAQELIQAGVEPAEFALRGPSLEEAFLTLTGSASTDVDGDDQSIDRTAFPVRTRPVVSRSAIRDVAVVTGRYWKHLLRTPQTMFFATVQPVLFVLALSAAFGGLVENTLGEDYIQFLLPGVVVMNLVLAAGTTGVGLATDLQAGIIDRFRSLPMAAAAVLVGRTTTDLVRNLLATTLMITAGFAIGFRLDAELASGLAALTVALLFGYAATWVFAVVGLAVKDPQAAAFLGFAPVLLFVYFSSAWVPIDTMSPAVQGFARHQPVNVTIESVRAFANGTTATSETIQSVAWSIGLVAVSAILATRMFRRAVA